jgi:RNA polymerase sigma factor (sigma-70 family)
MTRLEYNRAVDDFADGLFRFAIKNTRSKEIAEDFVQDTFMKVWEKHETIEFTKCRSYLFTTMYHLIVDWSKKPISISENNTLQSISTKEQKPFDIQKIIDEALDKLNYIQKTVLMLRDYEGYTYSEIAEITSLSETQVKVYIFRARQQMKAYIVKLDLVL